MSMMTVSVESLREQTGLEIEDLHVLVAKNSVAGLDAEDIATILGVTVNEVIELQATAEYKSARLLLGTEYSRQQRETDFSWDDIESTALQSLSKRVKLERDTDMLLRIATLANKAQRRTPVSKGNVLDPARGGQQVRLNLTQRITEKLANGTQRTVEKHVSVLDGSAVNPKFDDIDALFGVSAQRQIPQTMGITTRETDVTLDDLKYGG